MATFSEMRQQHQQTDSIGREQREGFAASRGAWVGTHRYEEIISPNSLLRSDRFAKTKAVVVAGQEEETARVSRQLSGRENRANTSSSGGCLLIGSRRIDAPNIKQRRATATTSADFGFNNVRNRGKAPVRARPATAGTISKVYTIGQQRNGQQNGGKHPPIRETTASRQRRSGASLFSNATAFQTDSAAQSQKTKSNQSCGPSLADSGITESCYGALLSQSPLRPASASLPTISSGHFQQSPMRSNPVHTRTSPDRMATKDSELEPSSHMDSWSSRCCNLTQQIFEHLRMWNQALQDGLISTSPIKSGSHDVSKSTSREWVNGKQIMPDPVSMTRTLLEELDQHSTSMNRLSQTQREGSSHRV